MSDASTSSSASSTPRRVTAAAGLPTLADNTLVAPPAREQARDVLDSVHAFHPLGRHGVPADVVEAILFLAGPRSAWITGTTLPIDGGVLAGRNAPAVPVGAAA